MKKVVLLLVLCFSGIAWFFLRPPSNIPAFLNSWHTQEREPQKAKSQEEKPNFVRSELTIPTDALLLDRSSLIGKLKTQLKRNLGRIHTIVLTGIGGSGKTTLARHYALLDNASIVWEINAETRETLLASFENLAQSLAKILEEKREIHTIREIKNATDKETQLIKWVHKHLSQSQSWLLFYDNVVSFRNIHKYLPSEQNVQGTGQILITTRNSQMLNNKIDAVLPVDELSPDEKLDLFTKILIQSAVPLIDHQREEVEEFLKGIPPFPLDVSLAAHYLRRTNVPYRTYLKHLKETPTDFQALQKEVLEEVGDYHKTRYTIVSLYLKDLIEIHMDFKELLLLICLLNAQDIPRDLLSTLKKDVTVDQFIHHLESCSFIAQADPFQKKAVFSVHTSIQENGLAYLRQQLVLDKGVNNSHLIDSLAETLGTYIRDVIQKQDFSNIHSLISHCEAFLSHSDWLTDENQNIISGELGNIYLHVSDYKAAQETLEKALTLNQKTPQKAQRARLSLYLADVYRETGDYDKAKTLLEESLSIYRNHFPKDHEQLSRILAHLGAVYRHVGDFKKSTDLLEESIALYDEQSMDDHPDCAWALVHLGNSYREMGDLPKAAEFLEKSLLIYKRSFPENSATTVWNMAQLGNIYREMGKYGKAQILLEESLAIYEMDLPHSHDRIAWTLTHLGDTYTQLEDPNKALTVLEKALSIHEKYFSKNHVGVARTFLCLGNAYQTLGELQKAQENLEMSLEVHLKHFSEKHLRLAPVILSLGNVYHELGQHDKAKEFLTKSLTIYEQSEGNHPVEKARVLRSLGSVYLKEENFDLCETALNRSLEIAQQHDHPDLLKTWPVFAELHLKKSAGIKR